MVKTLENHKIYFYLLNDLRPISMEILNSKKENRNPIFTKKQILIKELFFYLTEIVDKQKDIRLAKDFLKSPRTLGDFKKIKDREVYIKYHIEFYQINVISIFDRILHLINFVYKLGLEDRHVNKDIICSNNNIPTELVKLIKKFDKDIKSIRTSQNRIKHKEKINLPELYNAKLLDYTLEQWKKIRSKKIKVNFSWSKKDEKYLKADADFYYSIFLKKEQEKINNINITLNKNILDIIENLYPIFKLKHEN